MENEPIYFPCAICAGSLYFLQEIKGKPVLCCENCACIDYNVEAMTDHHPQSEASIKRHSLGALSVTSRKLMNALSENSDTTAINNLESQLEIAYKSVIAD